MSTMLSSSIHQILSKTMYIELVEHVEVRIHDQEQEFCFFQNAKWNLSKF